MAWSIEYIKEAQKDLKSLDQTQRIQVLKAIEKVSENPLPNTEDQLEKVNSKSKKIFKVKKLKKCMTKKPYGMGNHSKQRMH